MPWLTPAQPVSLIAVSFDVPDTILPVFVGAMLETVGEQNWEKFGDMDIETALLYCQGVLDSLIETALPPPYNFLIQDATGVTLADDVGAPLIEG